MEENFPEVLVLCDMCYIEGNVRCLAGGEVSVEDPPRSGCCGGQLPMGGVKRQQEGCGDAAVIAEQGEGMVLQWIPTAAVGNTWRKD